MARTRTTIEIDGIAYVWDTAKVRGMWKYYEKKCKNTPQKNQVIIDIAEKTNFSDSTVKDWLNGRYGPSDPNVVEVIAKALECNSIELLKLKNEERIKMEERKITKMERKAARRLYGELCDMLEIIDWEDESIVMQFPMARIRAWSRFEDPYEAEQYYLLLVRKNAIDLPKGIIEELKSLISEAFNLFSDSIDPPYELNIHTDGYKKILEEKEWEKKREHIYLYVRNYRERISEELDRIFDRYMRK